LIASTIHRLADNDNKRAGQRGNPMNRRNDNNQFFLGALLFLATFCATALALIGDFIK